MIETLHAILAAALIGDFLLAFALAVILLTLTLRAVTRRKYPPDAVPQRPNFPPDAATQRLNDKRRKRKSRKNKNRRN